MKTEASITNNAKGTVRTTDCTFLYGAHIIMTGFAGAEVTVKKAMSERELLNSRFSPSYLDRIMNIPVPDEREMKAVKDIACHALPAGAEESFIVCAGDGGIYAALWNLGEMTGCGMEVRHKDIPILQETIEVCNLLDINPYKTESNGCLLLVTDTPGDLIEELDRADIPAADIGCLTSERKRVIINGENERFLERP